MAIPAEARAPARLPNRVHLVLSGPMGVGKTTLGRQTAKLLGWPFVDVDEAIERSVGAPVSEWFEAVGEAAFRARESEVVVGLLSAEEPHVIALGGGSLLDPRARALALTRGFVVGLTADVATLVSRTAGSDRPLLRGQDPEAVLLSVLASRREVYRTVHASMKDPTAERLAECVRSEPLAIGNSSAFCYAAQDLGPQLDSGAHEILGDSSGALLITDATVDALHGEAFRRALGGALRGTVRLTPGEENKHWGAVEAILGEARSLGLDRQSVFIGLGGGVVTDLTGFAASVFQRGVRWVAVPTTAMAMVDAATGGKTGFNFLDAKNYVGSFHHPSAVWLHGKALGTESPRGIRSGIAEAIKSAFLADPALYEELCEGPLRDWVRAGRPENPALEAQLVRALRRALRVKVDLVERDPRESGDRALLNLGHTVGHALESATGFSALTHGEAVALGMLLMAEVGRARGLTSPDVVADLGRCLSHWELLRPVSRADLDRACEALGADKKRDGGAIGVVIPRRPGQVERVAIGLASLEKEVRAAAEQELLRGFFGRPGEIV